MMGRRLLPAGQVVRTGLGHQDHIQWTFTLYKQEDLVLVPHSSHLI
jgi:hypothetical protein